MQTKAIIFLLSVSIYLLGLVAYSNHRAEAQTRLASKALTTAAFSRLADRIEGTVPPPHIKPRRVVALKEQPKAVSVDPLIVGMIRDFNRHIDEPDASELAKMIEQTAERYHVDPLLVTALVSQESAFYTDAVSPVGAIGLGQLMPYTAADLGVDPSDPLQNLDGCVRYLAQNLDTWAHTEDPVSLALASYNAGPGAVQGYGGIPPYEETQNYVAVINYRYRQLLLSAETATTDYTG